MLIELNKLVNENFDKKVNESYISCSLCERAFHIIEAYELGNKIKIGFCSSPGEEKEYYEQVYIQSDIETEMLSLCLATKEMLDRSST